MRRHHRQASSCDPVGPVALALVAFNLGVILLLGALALVGAAP